MKLFVTYRSSFVKKGLMFLQPSSLRSTALIHMTVQRLFRVRTVCPWGRYGLVDSLDKRHERELAGLVPGGELTIASGAKHEKRDVQSRRSGSGEEPDWWRFLYEAKCTQKKGYRVTAELWKEIEKDVLERSVEMRPALALRFYGESKHSIGSTPVLADLVLVDLNDFVELLEELRHLKSTAEG